MYGQRWPQRHLPPEPEPPGITLCVHERKDALSRLRPPHAAAICSGKAAGTALPGLPTAAVAGLGGGGRIQRRWAGSCVSELSAGTRAIGLSRRGWSTRSKEVPGCTRSPVPPGTPPGTSPGIGGCWSIPGSVRQARLGLTPGSILMFGGPTIPAVLIIPAVSAAVPTPVHQLFFRT